MANLPALTGSQVVKVLQEYGFVTARTNSSHYVMRHRDGRTTVVAVHAKQAVSSGTFRQICNDTGISKEDLVPGRGKALSKKVEGQGMKKSGDLSFHDFGKDGLAAVR